MGLHGLGGGRGLVVVAEMRELEYISFWQSQLLRGRAFMVEILFLMFSVNSCEQWQFPPSTSEVTCLREQSIDVAATVTVDYSRK